MPKLSYHNLFDISISSLSALIMLKLQVSEYLVWISLQIIQFLTCINVSMMSSKYNWIVLCIKTDLINQYQLKKLVYEKYSSFNNIITRLLQCGVNIIITHSEIRKRYEKTNVIAKGSNYSGCPNRPRKQWGEKIWSLQITDLEEEMEKNTSFLPNTNGPLIRISRSLWHQYVVIWERKQIKTKNNYFINNDFCLSLNKASVKVWSYTWLIYYVNETIFFIFRI